MRLRVVPSAPHGAIPVLSLQRTRMLLRIVKRAGYYRGRAETPAFFVIGS